jgi:hypothetical protein
MHDRHRQHAPREGHLRYGALVEAMILDERRRAESRKQRRTLLMVSVLLLLLYGACSFDGRHSDSAATPLELQDR